MSQTVPELIQPSSLLATSAALSGRHQSGKHRPGIELDREVPALLLKIGQYPVHSGGLAVIRTLGRLGVPVYAITEPGRTPAGVSRYCTATFEWHATGHEDQDELIAELRAVGDEIGRPAVLIPVDDEAAVLVAEHQAELAEHFLFPKVKPDLPRQLASKPGLFELCVEHGFPAPASVTPQSMAQAAAFAATATFPVVVKNAEVWERRQRPVVPGTTVVRSEEELLALIDSAACHCRSHLPEGEPGHADYHSPGVILQEYLPAEHSEDWIVHLYCDAGSASRVLFTGLKVRSWPPQAGVTACAYSISNPALAELAEEFCAKIGFVGIADLDVRLDLRDGQYKLVDFNPRTGNQFRLFESEAGVDVVRALHLDLTGRAIQPAPQVLGKRIIVEHADLPAWFAYRRLSRAAGQVPLTSPGHTSTEYAWVALDDPFPLFVMVRHVVRSAVAQLRRRLAGRFGRPQVVA